MNTIIEAARKLRWKQSWLPDSSFYPSPRMARDAPPETLAYVAMIEPDPASGRGDLLGVVDCDPESSGYGSVTHRMELPNAGDELHHFGWNACSASLCPYAPHPHLRRRYLVVPGLRSSRIYIVDTQPDPGRPRIVKTIQPEELARKTGYSRPHTVHCGPDGIYVSAIGNVEGEAPGGILVLDHESFEPLGPWEIDRGPQKLAYDFWWHLGWDVMVTSEWGTPNTIENGLQPEVLMARGYGRNLHFWDLRSRRHQRAIELGEHSQFVLELRPAHDPTRRFGFAGVVINIDDLSSSVWMWHQRDGEWQAQEVIRVPAEAATPDQLPPALKPFSAVPPLLTDIALSLDDRFLYLSCWGTGELRQYDVSDPFHPEFVGSVHLGGIVRRTAHPTSAERLNGGPQMIEVSRDGRRIYLTNSLYRSWDDQFYPDGIRGWMAKLDVGPQGGINVDPAFMIDFGHLRPHQVRLQGGDASSDSFCYA